MCWLQTFTLLLSLISHHYVQFLTYLLQATCCTFSTDYILRRLISYKTAEAKKKKRFIIYL